MIKQAKFDCYPQKESIEITERSAEVQLQALLDCTVKRLVKAQQPVFGLYMNSIDLQNVEMIYKWGFDGSSGQSQYKQKFSSDSLNNAVTDANMILTSVVPIQMYGYDNNRNNEKLIFWQNPKVSSTKYCRPIHFQFKKETKQTTKEEVKHIQAQIQNLQPSHVIVGNVELAIKHKLILTMVDQKVCNSITDTSSQKCYICAASPKDMNNLELVNKRPCNASTYSFGLSVLHAHIRFFECLLHIAYRMDFKKWQARTQEEKDKMNARKKLIIERFRKEYGILVDQPKQGSGNTNDGNTARRF